MISANCYYMQKRNATEKDKYWLEYVALEKNIAALISDINEKGLINVILLDTFVRPAYDYRIETGCDFMYRLDTETVNKFLILLNVDI